MIKIEKTDIYGWEVAIRGARNSFNSWDKSDSGRDADWYGNDSVVVDADSEEYIVLHIGPNDQKLMKKLAKAGPSHAKYRRFITVTMDVTGPLYWWKEMDTYKVGTVGNSCSTMHKIADKEFELEDFSIEHLYPGTLPTFKAILAELNCHRYGYLHTNYKEDWWQMIQLLPSSYNQKRTLLVNYEVLANIYHQRKGHKLDEWQTFCEWIKGLPMSEIITGDEKE
jgi:hypothetical protein